MAEDVKVADHQEELKNAEVDVMLREKDDAAVFANEAEEVSPDDVDAKELAEAKAGLIAFQNGEDGDSQEPDEGDKADEAPPGTENEPDAQAVPADAAKADEAADPEPDKATAGATMPMGAFNERIQKERDKTAQAQADAQKAREEAAFWKGHSSAKGTDAGTTPPGDVPQPQTSAEKIAEIRTKQSALAASFDDGDITMATLTTDNAALEDQIFDIRTEALRQPGTTQGSTLPVDDMRLQELTRELPDKHPYIVDGVLAREDIDMLAVKAFNKLASEGNSLPTDRDLNAIQQWDLRRTMAELSDIYGPGLAPDFKPAEKPQPNPTPKPGGLDEKAAARAGHLANAQRQPPNTNDVGSAGPALLMSKAEFIALNDEEVMKIPEAERRRIINS